MEVQPLPEEPSRRQTTAAETLHKGTEIGIYNETDRLRNAVIWGPIGVEAVLAQLYPNDISLFLDEMDVPKARHEAASFNSVLKGLDVNVIQARNELATLLPQQDLQKEAVITSLLEKAHQIEAQYPSGINARTQKRLQQLGGLNGSQTPEEVRQQIIQEIDSDIARLVEEDIQRYGEQAALNLNKALCLNAKYPLGDLLYARDPMNVLLGTRFISNMKYDIRQPEVALYEQVYNAVLAEDAQSVAIPEGETFEGGDAYVHNGVVYVGVGVRTTKGAAEFIYQTLRPQLDKLGLKFAIVEDEHPETRPQVDQMDFMHLDTFSGPIGDKEIAVCDEEAERRVVKYFNMGEDGKVMTVNTGENFLQHLQNREHVIIVPREEQKGFGCNFLAIDSNTILLPSDKNTQTIAQLERLGKRVLILQLPESLHGYGAAHCMTGQLLRAR